MNRPAASWSVAALGLGAVMTMDPSGWHPFGPSKWVVITVFALLAAAFAFGNGVELHRTSTQAWAGFLIWAAVTALLSVDPLSSWIGTPDRRMGVVGFVTLAAAYIGGMGVRAASGRVRVARASTLALSAASAYGVAEAAGWSPIPLTTTTDRLGSTFGSPAYLGAAVCLLAPISAGLGADRSQPATWRWAGSGAALGGIFLLGGSGTRAALFGLAGAGAVLLVRRLPTNRRAWRSVAVVIAVGAVGVAFSPLGTRLMDTAGAAGRMAEWRVATDTLISDPFTGTGLEGYRIAFPDHVDIDYVQAYGRSIITDRAHSGPLDAGVATGLAGMAAWFVAAAFIGRRAWMVMDPSDPVLVGLAVGLIGLWVQELFLFPTLEVSTVGWAVAGIVVVASPTGTVRTRSRTFSLIAAVLALTALVVGSIDVVADRRAAKAREESAPAMAERAVDLLPFDYRYRLLAADLWLRAGELELASNQIDAGLEVFPDEPALRLAKARVVSLSATDQRAAGQAATVLDTLVARDRHHPELRLLHGEVLARAGRAGEAERAFLAAAELSPGDPAPQVFLAHLYLDLGKVEEARRAVERIATLDPAHPQLELLRDKAGT